MKFKFSLKKKAIAMVFGVSLILTAISITASYQIYSKMINDHYKSLAEDISKTASAVLDKESVGNLTDMVMEQYRKACPSKTEAPNFEQFSDEEQSAYDEAFDWITQTTEYKNVYQTLSDIRESNGIKSLYICYMDMDTKKAVYIIDASNPSDACTPGTCDNIESRNLESMKAGNYNFAPYITNYEKYGWLCSAASAIYSEDGAVIANAYVDISMTQVRAERHRFLVILFWVLMVATAIVAMTTAVSVTMTSVRTVNKLASAAESFVSELEKKEKGVQQESAISKLEIHTGDEIENLARSIQKMEVDINQYIKNLAAITAEKERIGAELNVATQIQASMLPSIFPKFSNRAEFCISASMAPAKEVGGDFYDFFMVDDRHLAIVMADVSGKGVPAALFMVIGKTLIKDHTVPDRDLGEVFMKVNNMLCESNSENLFITAFEGVLDLVTGELTYVNAGHEMPFIYRGENFEVYKLRPGFVLAGMENMKYRTGVTTLKPGDKLFQYTDGVTEATNAEKELYGMDRLTQILNKNKEKTPEEILVAVRNDVDKFAGSALQFDDITMLCLEYKCRMEEISDGQEQADT